MKFFHKGLALLCTALLAASTLLVSGCGQGSQADNRRVIRIGHAQPQNHPEHAAFVAFKEYIEGELGDKYKVEIYPSELLGSQTNLVQLTQTGAIDMCIVGNALLSSFSQEVDVFNLPYLFASNEVFDAAMEDPNVTEPIFRNTQKAGFKVVSWVNVGTRNFYTVNTPINSPADMKGLKFRVQQSNINVRMMQLLGANATPMSFGEVYTSLQSGVIDGAENNELSLTANGHGDVCKYYTYDVHQMVLDDVIASNHFLEEVKENGDLEVFEKGFKLISQVGKEKCLASVREAKEKAEKEKGVHFIYPDQKPFVEACQPLYEEVLAQMPSLRPIYDAIQVYNKEYSEKKAKEGGK